MVPDLNFWLVGGDDPVDDPSRFIGWLTATLQTGQPLAIDTETRGLNWRADDQTRLVQFGTRDEGWAVPVRDYRRLAAHAMQLVSDSSNDIIMHNSKFDMHALEADGFAVPGWHRVQDTMVMHHLNSPKDLHGLKPITERMFGKWASAGGQILKEYMKRAGVGWDTVDVYCPFYWGYGVIDTILTRRLYDELRPTTPEVPYHREMAYTEIMYRVECRGLRVDSDYSANLRDAWTEKAENLALRLKAIGIKNPNSNQQVEAAMKSFGWSPSEFTDTGQAQLDKYVMALLSDMPSPIGPAADQLVEYRRLTKWVSTYLDPFSDTEDGRVYPSIRTLGAKTGRSSITDPPLQTLPSRGSMAHYIKDAILPEEGHQLYAIDYSGQEYRILASLSQDPAWVYEFLHGAGDPHTMVADMLHIQREQAKTFNFAQVYGAGVGTLSVGTGLSVDEVNTFLSVYAKRFPKIIEFIKDTGRQGYLQAQDGEIPHVITAGGRRAEADDDQLYALVNYKIQGSGADVLKEATCRLDAAGLADFIMVPVHDELVFSFPTEDAAYLANKACNIMTNTDWFDLPIVAEIEGPYPTWGNKYKETA